MGSDALFSPQEIQQAGGSAPSAFSSPAPGGNLFSADEISQAGGQTADQRSAAADDYKQQKWSEAYQNFKSGNIGAAVSSLGELFNNPNQDEHQDLTRGVIKGAGDTVAGVGSLINRIPVVGETLAPKQGVDALRQMSTATNTGQKVGKSAEALAEFVIGDEALKGVSLAEKAAKAAKLADTYEKASPFVRAALESALRVGTVSGVETTAKTGSITEGAEAAGAGAALGLATEAAGAGAGKAVKYVRDLYKPLATVESVQPVLQDGIRSVLSDVADEAGVEMPKAGSIRDVAADVADGIRAKSQDTFQQLDKLSDGAFSDAQADAAKYRGSLDKAGKDAYSEAIEKQDSIFDQFRSKFDDPTALDDAKANWKQAMRLDDLSDKIRSSVQGSRPGIKGPIEDIDAKSFDKKLNSLFNNGDLQDAVGPDNAHKLLDHSGQANQQIADIKRGRIEQASQRNAFRQNVVRPAVKTAATGLGIGGGIEAVSKIRKALGGEK
jgi:hypothetical protein